MSWKPVSHRAVNILDGACTAFDVVGVMADVVGTGLWASVVEIVVSIVLEGITNAACLLDILGSLRLTSAPPKW